MLKDFTQMTAEQRANARVAVRDYFNLDDYQADRLRVDPMCDKILFAVHNTHWVTARVLLSDAGII